jgi:hypothetical protein
MTIRMWLLILTLAVGSGTSQSLQSDPSNEPPDGRPKKVEGNCWINGVWYNPCPNENSTPLPTPEPAPNPDIQYP